MPVTCNATLSIAHYGYVLQTGEVVLEGEAASLRNDPTVQHAYLGEVRAA